MKDQAKSQPKVIHLRGTVTSGQGIAGGITEFPWVKGQFIAKLGINPYPGTFNISVLPEDEEKLRNLRETKGIEILPPNERHCAGNTFFARVNGKVRGAVVMPHVPDYPPAQLEVISPQHVRRTLGLKDGDTVEVEVYL